MIDIVIVTYNRVPMLTALLEKLKVQSVQDFRVIICDDGSGEIIGFNKYPFVHKYTWSADTAYNKIARLNEGISYCLSDKMLLLDDDMLPRSDRWIERHMDNLGKFDISRGSVRFRQVANYDGKWFCTANMGFRLESLKRVGCFDMAFNGIHGGGDIDLGETVKKNKLTWSDFHKDTICDHVGPDTHECRGVDSSKEGKVPNRVYFKEKWGYDWVENRGKF